MVSEVMLEKFKSLYLKKYKVSLTNEKATEMANGLVNLMSILLKPEPPITTDKQHSKERGQDETITTRDY